MIQHPLYKRGNCYLSGGMQFAPNLGASWREIASKKLKEMEYYPIDISALDRAYAKVYGELYLMKDKANHLQYKSNFRRHFVHADVQLILQDSDALIVLYDESVRRGAGTTSEIHEAYEAGLPVFLVSSYKDWHNEVPGWMQAETTKIFSNFDELFKYLDELPFGILKKDIYGNHGIAGDYLCSLCGNIFEKARHHFVSKISPTYCSSCVDLITKTHEGYEDRYSFILNAALEEGAADMREKIRLDALKTPKADGMPGNKPGSGQGGVVTGQVQNSKIIPFLIDTGEQEVEKTWPLKSSPEDA